MNLDDLCRSSSAGHSLKVVASMWNRNSFLNSQADFFSENLSGRCVQISQSKVRGVREIEHGDRGVQQKSFMWAKVWGQEREREREREREALLGVRAGINPD